MKNVARILVEAIDATSILWYLVCSKMNMSYLELHRRAILPPRHKTSQFKLLHLPVKGCFNDIT
jgi:hypothetical protein